MTERIVFDDAYLRMYINQWVTGRSIPLQGQMQRMERIQETIAAARTAQEIRRRERIREITERAAMAREDPMVIQQKQKAKAAKKKALQRL